MKCRYCQVKCVKKGVVKKRQRYQCKNCKKYQQKVYQLNRIPQEKYQWVKRLTCEGCGISSIGRLLHITKSSVQRVIERIAATIKSPVHTETHQDYEMDELRTYCGNKKNESWLMKRLNRKTICFTRTENMLSNCVRLYCYGE